MAIEVLLSAKNSYFHHGLIIIARVLLRKHKKYQQHKLRKRKVPTRGGSLRGKRDNQAHMPLKTREDQRFVPDVATVATTKSRNEVCDTHLLQFILNTQRRILHARYVA